MLQFRINQGLHNVKTLSHVTIQDQSSVSHAARTSVLQHQKQIGLP